MSITVCYRPTSTKFTFSSGTSDQFDKLLKIFGNTIGFVDRPKLEAIYIATNDKFYEEVLDALDTYGEINIWAEY